MKAREMMTVSPYVCATNETITRVVHELLDRNIQGVPVVNADGSLAGLVGHQQLYKAIGDRINFDAPVHSFMQKDVTTISPEIELEDIYPPQADILPVIEDGKIIGVITAEDITLSRINTFLQMEVVMESDDDAIVGINEEKKIIIFNKASETMFNIPKKEVLGKQYQEIFPDGCLNEVLDTHENTVNQKTILFGQTFLANRNPIMRENTIIGAVEIFQNISKVEEIFNELEYVRASKASLDAIIEASFDSIFVTDALGNVISVNEAYTRITDIKVEDVLGRNMYDLVNEGFYDKSATIMVIENHKPVTFTQKIKSGRTMTVTGNPIFNEQGELVMVLTNGRDITELNRLRMEVEQANSLSKYYGEELKRATMKSGEMIVNSKKTKEILDLVLRLGQVETTVLVYGDSGVGKELIVKELHNNSTRKSKPLISINCAAIPESLLESELFGYVSGAFSGAVKNGKMGTFEIANGGSLFLDEIGELPLNLQAKLLRAIQEKEITRIGGSSPIKVDVRIITATNRNLVDMVKKKQFREDLYYRLNVVPIYVPPLMERKEEIPALVFHFMKLFNERYNLNKTIDERLMTNLIDYNWPGNVRELKNVIERAIVTSPESVITSVNLSGNTDDHSKEDMLPIEDGRTDDLKGQVDLYEKELLKEYINTYKTSRKVARALAVSQTTIVRKAAQYGIKFKGR